MGGGFEREKKVWVWYDGEGEGWGGRGFFSIIMGLVEAGRWLGVGF